MKMIYKTHPIDSTCNALHIAAFNLNYVQHQYSLTTRNLKKARQAQRVAILHHKISCYGNVPWPKFTKFLAVGILHLCR